jgi:hypothetical protein
MFVLRPDRRDRRFPIAGEVFSARGDNKPMPAAER